MQTHGLRQTVMRVHGPLHLLTQVLREEDQREEKWAHSGVSRESHEAIVKMLKEKETDIQELRLRLSLAEKVRAGHVSRLCFGVLMFLKVCMIGFGI